MSTRTRPALDVSELPEIAFGHRDPLWWGVAGLIAIESTMVVLLVASFVYLRGNYHEWPPTGFGVPVQLLALAEALVLAASAFSTPRTNLAALDGDLRRIQRWLAVTTALGAVFCGLRGSMFAILPFHWDLHAYASVVWGLLGLNFLHALSGTLENAAVLGVALRGPFEKKHLVDVHSSGFLWYFVVWSWLPVYALVFLLSRFIRSGG
jgi:cytochrome c oxidase subunit III